jgi:transcription initiation factor TFIIIB Brf1 subunit/transcription initiation factor TFIIB
MQPQNQKTVLVNTDVNVKKQQKEEECTHSQTMVTDSKTVVCAECFLELKEEINNEQEWRYYKENDSKNSSDPSRCQYKRIVDKGIKKDLERMDFHADIIDLADQYYNEVTNGEIKRSNLRRGIMFACVFQACKDLGKPEIPERLCEKFGIDRKNMSKGLTFFHMGKKKDREMSTSYITARHFIPDVLKPYRVKDEYAEKIYDLFDRLEHKSHLINTSNPQSVAAGLVYYYFRKNNIDIPVGKFSDIAKLSEITITKIADAIDEFFSSQPEI